MGSEVGRKVLLPEVGAVRGWVVDTRADVAQQGLRGAVQVCPVVVVGGVKIGVSKGYRTQPRQGAGGEHHGDKSGKR